MNTPLSSIELNYEDRCLIRMNALSKYMSPRELAKKTGDKVKSMTMWDRIIYLVVIVVSILALLVYVIIWFTSERGVRINVIYLWVMICIITVLIFFSM